ncbi:MAG TPA: hypothetical protein VGP08_04630 [Pyrinomonadaceae bacterium]|nr:hypothetical protein [Pyrinomonadaceae bacterium]
MFRRKTEGPEESLAREDELNAFDLDEDSRESSSAHGAVRRFAPDELVACGKCSRANAPTRMNCLYCGAPLPVTEQSAALRRPALRKLEEWEQGFNIVLHPPSTRPAPETIEELAAFLRLDAARLSEMLDAGTTLPVARAASGEEAELIVSRIKARGLDAEVLNDDLLARTPVRVRALGFDADALVLMTTAEATPAGVFWDKVVLLVVGRIVTRRVELEERPSKLSGRGRLTDAREVASDEAVLDIYTSDAEHEGFRVMADGFDYSCLGAGKGLLARDNFKTLVAELRARAASAALDEGYARLRAQLASAWPPAERNESGGLRRERPGRLNTESVTVVSNEAQFTRYARMRRLLVLRGRAKSL